MGIIVDILGLFILLGIPFFLSVHNFIGLFHEWKKKRLRNILWIVTFILGELYTYIDLGFCDVIFDANWDEQLYNMQMHQPIWTGGIISVATISLVGIVGACILSAVNVNKLPPIVSVLCITAMYMTLAIQITWTIQCAPLLLRTFEAMYILVPINLAFIAYTIIKEKIKEWAQQENHQVESYGKNPLIKNINRCLIDSKAWPMAALFCFLPMLGVLLIILILFGQEPDAIIKAWTETSDWTLSLREGPQNIFYDEHYLCTVAAGGHRKVVKPLRMGERHGHPVIVNRQLLIANAFENVLEEKTPKFHRAVRDFYDKYGFPVADLIRTNKIACDITYIIMKPLEWIFLIVLYIVDSNPENRIAVQYLPRKEKR